ncbi:hypothetical protein GW17_00024716 [Ensete ventricosum]|nr:hypothetical protein GW17_00024716 [Ensete ventricosum]
MSGTHKKSLSMDLAGQEQHRTGSGKLPDDLHEEILSRLPAKTTLRLQPVYKSFQKLSEESHFLLSQSYLRKIIFGFFVKSYTTFDSFLLIDPCADVPRTFGKFLSENNGFILGSADGLVFVVHDKYPSSATTQPDVTYFFPLPGFRAFSDLTQSRESAMLPFQGLIVSDLLDDPNGGLVVLSSGLPLPSLVASLILLHDASAGSLLLLSASDTQKSAISAALRRYGQPDLPLPSDILGSLPSHNRTAIYASGAVLFVTPRVLVADLLTSRVPPSSIAALVVLNAHRLSDTSTEAFIARILRDHSPSFPIHAFSDRPHAMVAGFAKAERIMKSLFVRRLHLWPRFHVLVSTDLERAPPEVVDVRVPMTPAMIGIQAAVLGSMDACLKELRRTNKVDVEDLTVENGLFKSFDEIVRRQLDPIWHTLGKKTKQLVSDLKTLRKLLDYLVR